MSRLAGPSCKSILYCKPEQPPPTTATRSTPVGRPCLVSSVETLLAALAVSLTRRSSPVRKFGADVGLVARLAIIFNLQQDSRLCRQGQRVTNWKHSTSNIQLSTANPLGVRCWKLNVECYIVRAM